MFDAGDVIDQKFLVTGPCSDAGGMGTLVFVVPRGAGAASRYVLKYCKLTGDEMLARFRREVRVMLDFKGNAHVMPIIDANLDHDPPYFVMPYFENGDLAVRAPEVRGNPAWVELVFNRMIDCVEQLHSRNVLHRDIKPQNFLVSNDALIVSDLGLCSENDAATALTRSSMYWGTPGYLPPEFLTLGGFKAADAASDIFMLGKTFYAVLTGRDPMYLVAEGVPGPLFPVIERCCAVAKEARYQSLPSLRQSLTSAFDVMLGRASGPGKAYSTLRAITDRLQATRTFQSPEVIQFVDELALLDDADRFRLCMELPAELFTLLAQGPVQSRVQQFIGIYRHMSEHANYGWSFAETIASNMKVLFESPNVSARDKAEALRAALISAERQNRFAAMATCNHMITQVIEEELAQRVHEVLLQHPYYFVENIDQSSCKAPAVRAAVARVKAQADEARAAAAANQGDDFPF